MKQGVFFDVWLVNSGAKLKIPAFVLNGPWPAEASHVVLETQQAGRFQGNGLGPDIKRRYTMQMHTEGYPASYNEPGWENVFLSSDDAQVDAACQAWFKQWCALDVVYSEKNTIFFECMPAMHALSNRVEANLDGFIALIDDDNDELRKQSGYLQARSMFTSAITATGWEGFAMRCWTDPKAYAGFMQYIEREGLYAYVNDLAYCQHAGGKLKEALDLYNDQIAYPWIGAACIRWAMFGRNTTVAELPNSVQWLKEKYQHLQSKNYWDFRTLYNEHVDFGSHAPVIKILLQSPDVWRHMLLQEDRHEFDPRSHVASLWIHWAESVGHECTREKALFEEGDVLAFFNAVFQEDAADLELMRLGGPRDYLMTQCLRGHTHLNETLPLPDDATSMGLPIG